MSELQGNAPVTEKPPHGYIIVGYDGENYRPLLLGAIGHSIEFDEEALMLLCGVERPPVGERKMWVPVKSVPDDDLRRLRTLLSSIPTGAQT